MGSTHSHGKRIAAMKAADGVTYYVGIEKTCESNVYPRTPRWGVVFMGTEDQVVKRIFMMGSSCEGGMLKGAGGRDILPENYIAGWLREMANPLVIKADEKVTIYASDSWAAPVEASRMDSFLKEIDAIDLDPAKALAAAVQTGEKVTLSLYEYFGLVSRLFGGGFAAPWRVLGEAFCYATLDQPHNQELGRKYALTQPSSELCFTYMRGELHGYPMIFELGDDQAWRSIGDEWECVQRFVRNLAERELIEPGTFRHNIKAYRERLANTPLAPMDQAVCAIVLDGGIPRYILGDVTKAQEQIEHRSVGTSILFNIADVPHDWGYYFSCMWGAGWSYWLFKEADNAETEVPVTEQLALIA